MGSGTRIVLVLVLVGLLFWFWTIRSRTPEELDLGSFAAPAWVMNAERLVYYGAEDSIVVERRADHFEIVHPIVDVADPTRVLQTLQAAKRLKPTRALPGEDLQGFGLEPPRHRLEVMTPEGESWSIALGDTIPVGGRVYAHVEGLPGEPTVLLLREFGARRDFYPPVEQLRDPIALALRSPIVDSVHVVTREHQLRAVRDSGEHWRALEPEGLELDPLPIGRAIRQLRTPVIRRFLPPDADPADHGLVPPRATWIVFQEARAETVRIGAVTEEADGVYVAPAGRRAIGEIPTDAFRELVDGWPALASRRLSYLGLQRIGRIEFPGTDAAYVRSDSGWVRLPEARLVRNGPALMRDLENLLALQWESYPLEPIRPPRSADSVSVRLVPDSTGAAGRSEHPLSSGPETLTFSVHGESGKAFARSDRREIWGVTPDNALRIWTYRRSHPEL